MYLQYSILFKLLDYCFDKSTDLDLPPFLGEISPYTWEGGPMNQEVYCEWKKRSENLISVQEILFGVVDLLSFYENKYNFDFTDTKKILFEISEAQFNFIVQ